MCDMASLILAANLYLKGGPTIELGPSFGSAICINDLVGHADVCTDECGEQQSADWHECKAKEIREQSKRDAEAQSQRERLVKAVSDCEREQSKSDVPSVDNATLHSPVWDPATQRWMTDWVLR